MLENTLRVVLEIIGSVVQSEQKEAKNWCVFLLFFALNFGIFFREFAIMYYVCKAK